VNQIDSKGIQKRNWISLDNAAKLYPAITTGELTSVFRLTAVLTKPINYQSLKEAVEITSVRFPYFSVSLGSGLFWYYLEFNKKPPRIHPEEKIPCTAFALRRKNEPLYRVLIRANRISVEFIHILTDGSGAIEYLKSLLYTYLKLTGNYISSSEGIILPDSQVSEDEFEDSFKKFFRKLPAPGKISKAWHLPFRLNDKPRLRILRAEMKVNEILELSRSKNVSITEYLVSVYLFSLQKIYLAEKEKRSKQKFNILRIEVPVNMRNKLPSRSMRNFSLFVMPEVDSRLGIYTFEEILNNVHHYMHTNSDIKQIARFMSSNVSHEKLLIIRVLPLFIKRLAISAFYKGLGSRRSSGIMTNLGIVKLPEDMERLVDSFYIVPPPPNTQVKVSCALVSFKEKIHMSFCNITESNELERIILKHLSDSGIHIKILNDN
jgi:NRPS condensation-like uncharacterized protein